MLNNIGSKALAVFFLGTLSASAQVKNPSAVEFGSLDHDVVTVTGYEIDIINPPTTVIQTITVAKANVTLVSGTSGSPTAVYRANLNIQPIAFGSYVTAMRTVASALKSDNSPISNVWTRVPGAPSKPEMK